MGQGLNTKVTQVVGDALQTDLEMIKITKAATEKRPNTSATAASSGSDLNGMALDAGKQIKARLVALAPERWVVAPDRVVFAPNEVGVAERWMTFPELVAGTYEVWVQLSAAWLYTPKMRWDRATGRGRPFPYCAHGTGAVAHGMGWLTTEGLWWESGGRLRTHSPLMYKIPLASDRPQIFNVRFADRSEKRERTIKRSKAVGEPPVTLDISALKAPSMAAASVADYRLCPRLDVPAARERVLLAMKRLRRV